MRQVWSFQKQVALRFVECARALGEIGNLLTDLAHLRLKLVAWFLPRTFRADVLAQAIALRLQLLQFRLGLAPLRIDPQYLVNLRLVAAASCGQTFTDE